MESLRLGRIFGNPCRQMCAYPRREFQFLKLCNFFWHRKLSYLDCKLTHELLPFNIVHFEYIDFVGYDHALACSYLVLRKVFMIFNMKAFCCLELGSSISRFLLD